MSLLSRPLNINYYRLHLQVNLLPQTLVRTALTIETIVPKHHIKNTRHCISGLPCQIWSSSMWVCVRWKGQYDYVWSNKVDCKSSIAVERERKGTIYRARLNVLGGSMEWSHDHFWRFECQIWAGRLLVELELWLKQAPRPRSPGCSEANQTLPDWWLAWCLSVGTPGPYLRFVWCFLFRYDVVVLFSYRPTRPRS